MDSMFGLRKIAYYISFPLSFIGFMLPIYASSKGIGVVEIGLLYSIFSFISILIRPAVGNLIDKEGRKKGILTGVILYSIVNLLFLVDGGFKYLFLARIFQSVAASFLSVSISTSISDISTEENRSENFGYINQSVNRGDLLGAFIGFGLLFNNIFEDPFKYIFVCYFIASLIALYYGMTHVDETELVNNNLSIKNEKDKENLILFLLGIGFLSFVTSLSVPIYLIYVKENITDKLSLISYLFLPSAILSLYLPKRFGKLADKHNREKMFLLSILAVGLLQGLIPLFKTYFYFMLIHTLIVMGVLLKQPIESSLVIKYVGEEERGKSYGLYSFVNGLGATLGLLLGSYIYETYGGTKLFIIKGLLMILFSIVGLNFYNRVKISDSKSSGTAITK